MDFDLPFDETVKRCGAGAPDPEAYGAMVKHLMRAFRHRNITCKEMTSLAGRVQERQQKDPEDRVIMLIALAMHLATAMLLFEEASELHD